MEENKNRKKKILIFIPEFPALTETFIERDISALIKRGNLDVTVLYLKKGKGTMSKEVEACSINRRLDFVSAFFSLKYLLFSYAKVKQAWDVLNRDLTNSYFKRLYILLKSLGYSYIVEKYSPNEIHVHFLSEPSTVMLAVSIITGIPFSINAHARDILEYPSLPKSKAKFAKFITVCNKNAYERCLEMAEEYKNKIHLVHHGISEEDIFSHPVELQKPSVPLIFMGGTRMTEKKGIEYMVDASHLLKERGIAHKVVLIGPGPLYQHISDKIKEYGLEDTFEMPGSGKGAPFSLISQYYRISDIFVLPILQSDSGDADGIPNTIIEAALAKLPIMTTDAGSVSELVIDDVTGVVVSQRNADMLATEIEKLLIDESRRTRLGNSAYQRAKEMFDMKLNVGKLESLLLL